MQCRKIPLASDYSDINFENTVFLMTDKTPWPYGTAFRLDKLTEKQAEIVNGALWESMEPGNRFKDLVCWGDVSYITTMLLNDKLEPGVKEFMKRYQEKFLIMATGGTTYFNVRAVTNKGFTPLHIAGTYRECEKYLKEEWPELADTGYIFNSQGDHIKEDDPLLSKDLETILKETNLELAPVHDKYKPIASEYESYGLGGLIDDIYDISPRLKLEDWESDKYETGTIGWFESNHRVIIYDQTGKWIPAYKVA